jgi:hypothetical protein
LEWMGADAVALLWSNRMVDSAEDNKALVRRYLETLWAQWDTPAAEAFLAPHYQRHLTPHTPPLGSVPQLL